MADPFLFNPVKVIITVLVAFLPAIIYSILIRYSEKYEREPWASIGQAFLWGGTLCIVAVILIRGYFWVYIQDTNPVLASDEGQMTFYIAVLITPFFAEIIKPIGLLFVRSDILEAEDGLIYGAVIGLGYTATENLLYGIFLAPLYGIDMFITVVFMRSMSVMFIQSSTTAITCYGITRAMKVKHKTGRFYAFPLFLGAAIGIHMTFNYIVFMNIFDVGDILFSMSSSLLFSIIFAFILMFTIYFKIYRLDRIDEKEIEEKEERVAAERDRAASLQQQSLQRPPPMHPAEQRRAPEPRSDYYNQDRPPPMSQASQGQFIRLYDRPSGPSRQYPGQYPGAGQGPGQPQQRPPTRPPRPQQTPPTQPPARYPEPDYQGTPRPPQRPTTPRPPRPAVTSPRDMDERRATSISKQTTKPSPTPKAVQKPPASKKKPKQDEEDDDEEIEFTIDEGDVEKKKEKNADVDWDM